jgi:hypothetical protein
MASHAEERYAEGHFRDVAEGSANQRRKPLGSTADNTAKAALPIPLGAERFASLAFPSDMSVRDLEILEKRLLFEIENGTLWDYLSLHRPAAKPARDTGETQEAVGKGNLRQIRPLRETS